MPQRFSTFPCISDQSNTFYPRFYKKLVYSPKPANLSKVHVKDSKPKYFGDDAYAFEDDSKKLFPSKCTDPTNIFYNSSGVKQIPCDRDGDAYNFHVSNDKPTQFNMNKFHKLNSCYLIGASMKVLLCINRTPIYFLVDTGSQISILNQCFVSGNTLTPTQTIVRGATGHTLELLGCVVVEVGVSERIHFQEEFYVSTSLSECILGMDFLEKHNCTVDLAGSTLYIDNVSVPLVSHVACRATMSDKVKQVKIPECISEQVQRVPITFQNDLSSLIQKFSDIFDDSRLGCVNFCSHEIVLTDTRPVKQMPRRVSFAQRDLIDREVKTMLEKGIIEPCSSPWATPIVLVKKKDGSTRFCVDYRRLNSQTRIDAFPLPNSLDIIDNLSGSCYFATLDLKSGFWQIPMHDTDKFKTAFCVPGGHYQFTRMPFGLVNATPTFQRCMEQILNGLLDRICNVFVDDIVIYAKSVKELLERLDVVLDRIMKSGLTVNSKKCVLFSTKINLLGHVICEEGVKPNPEKVSVIESWKTPTTRKEMRSFLGLASYYRRFVQGFAQLAAPLHQLCSLRCDWKWSEAQDKAFLCLKTMLVNTPVLGHFKTGDRIIIDTDASGEALGAILSQVDAEGKERVIAYYSRCLSHVEKNYCVTRRELLAVIDSLRHWRHYVSGVSIIVRTDHASLTWLRNFKQPEGQLARWLERLAEFHIDLQYRRGAASGNADGLSRRPCNKDCSHCLRKEDKDVVNCSLIGFDVTGIDWVSEQAKDDNLARVREWIESGNVPEWEQVSGETSCLKSYWQQIHSIKLNSQRVLIREFHLPVGQIREQILIPNHFIKDITISIHEQGHFGIKRTSELLSSNYYFHNWKSLVKQIVQSCMACSKRKGPSSRTTLPLKRYQASEPLQRIAIDILGPLPLTSSGNKYLLVITDYFSKWADAIPIPTQETKVIIDALMIFISNFGIPVEIHSDQGRNFESFLMSALCERLGIHKTRTTPYYPRSDGQTERFNRTLLAALAKICTAENEWDKFIPIVCMYYRATTHCATGTSPALLMLGRELRLPVHVMFPPAPMSQSSTYSEYASDLENRLSLASEYARKHLRVTWETMKNRNVPSRNIKPLSADKPVLIFNPSTTKGGSMKLRSCWKGPYRIIEMINPYLYRIAVGGRRGSQVIHRSNIFQPETIEN
jgi:hypothetical protein